MLRARRVCTIRFPEHVLDVEQLVLALLCGQGGRGPVLG